MVDIADRQLDYTDEEKASEAIAEFQLETGLTDDEVVSLWTNSTGTDRASLEERIFKAVDANGSVKRARQTVPAGITLAVESETA